MKRYSGSLDANAFLGTMSPKIWVCIFVIVSQMLLTRALTNSQDASSLNSLKALWKSAPSTWKDYDPCGSGWEGVVCSGTRVITITLPSMGLQGSLSGDIQGLSELQSLDLSYNKGLTGPLPDAIGKLSKLTNLVLVGCGFSGPIPDSIGSLTGLNFLSLNSNSFTGNIPASIGNLQNLYWLDLADNQLVGSLPVSDGKTTPGLDLLIHTKHFHFGNNKLSGSIPAKLFNSSMSLLHLLLDHNSLTGPVPDTLGLVTTLEVVRLDRNMLTGLPSSINNLTGVSQLVLSNNIFSGPMPNLAGMKSLTYVDMSNNSFVIADSPSWFTTLPALTTLILEKTNVRGLLPVALFSLPQLQTVILRSNMLNDSLDVGASYSTQLELVDLEKNYISSFMTRKITFQLILKNNPVCQQLPDLKYCIDSQQPSTPYSTPANNCIPPACSSGQISSPMCSCAYPYSGTLVFRAPTFSGLGNTTYFTLLETSLMSFFSSHQLPVDSVSLSNATVDDTSLKMNLQMFPRSQIWFNRTGISFIGFSLSNQTYKPPAIYGPYYFIANEYTADGASDSQGTNKKVLSTAAIVGIAVGGFALFVLLVLIVVLLVVICLKSTKKPVEEQEIVNKRVYENGNSFKSSSSIPRVAGARFFTFEEMKRSTNNFSEANDIGAGGYGKVYKGVLQSGQLVAVKRADPRSTQGGLEFKTEIELLSRVHHKNLVNLLGFCSEQDELMLVYEYIPNGTLKQSLSGKSGVRLDWKRRVKVTLGVARGLQYLHELANPPIIHRDIKSNNILLDETLSAKVADFGLSKPLEDSGKGHMTTQVKGTMGYMDPEYYMTQRLTEKSDVYSFGVLMLEIITGKAPIERGRYVVREVRNALDKAQDLYNLHELVDPAIGLGNTLGGFERYVDLALRCVQETGSNRPAMGEVVKELENIMEAAGLSPFSDSANTSAAFPDTGGFSPHDHLHPYSPYGSDPR